MPYTKEAILPLVEQLKQFTDYEDTLYPHLHAGIDFLTGTTFTVPEFAQLHEAAQMNYFLPLLQLPDHWDDNDRLILQLLAPPLTWAACQERFLQTIVPLMDAPGTSSSVVLRFSYFTSFLQQRGCTPAAIGSLLISYSGDGNNFDLAPLKFTPLRKFLQDLIKGAEWATIDDYLRTWKQKGWNSLFYRLLSKGHPDREMEYLDSILQQHRQPYTNYELIKVLLQNNFPKYETVVERANNFYTTVPDYAALLNSYQLLARHLPEKYNTPLIQTAYAFLETQHNGMVALDNQPAADSPENEGGWLPPGVSAIQQLLLLDTAGALSYLDQYISDKHYLHPQAFQVMKDLLQARAVPLLLQALENDYDARNVLPVLTQLDKQLYEDRLWPFTLHKLKSVRSLVAVVLADHPQALEKAGELLLHKKAEQRLTAVQILCKLNTAAARELLQQALHKEINDDARDMMLEVLGDTLTGMDDMAAVTELVAFARKRGKLSRFPEPWLDESTLPPLYLLDGTTATSDMVRFLLYRLSRIKEIQVDIEARPLLRLVDQSRSGGFAAHLFKLYTDKGGEARLRYLMVLAALTGDDALVESLHRSIYQWIEEKRLKQAEHGVAALALQGSLNALRAVEFLSRKYQMRRPQVGAAAAAALQQTATEAGISLHELGDRLVPDFGFRGLFRPFAVRDEIYHAGIDSQFKLTYFNKNKRQLKAMPAATPSPVKETFKRIAKAITETAKLQSQRLEHYLVIQRKWTAAQWTALFGQHPLMCAFATRLLWGVYDEQEQLIQCFRYREDTAMENLAGETVVIPARATVRILHPLYLDATTLQQWKQQFAALGMLPVFPQLDRPVAALSPIQADSTVIHDFEDISLESEVLHQLMDQKGWKLSEGNDGKYMYVFHKTDDENQLEVIMEMSGVYQEDAASWRMGKLYFVDRTKTQQRWFRTTDKEVATGLLPLHSVPPVFYSEAITDITVSREKMSLS
ncbi:DUF4132 domain-containing protein [Chitinophaga nivalis]|uniref:DUF4132 domain-containing protein n=1 Tax=Chitinophaga nivalis TaxID=2991709 RepID=A0ABT3IJ19_9BACT|nr:DUF4132 domain-containing protein [Chitinophaga nivalis]MCW3466565.1 DUF4132 domain-containing protein [Chitinophaga nivalis]MCW3483744.1 DUF4132 domain-containing protein [Chitinophaga nivalis]